MRGRGVDDLPHGRPIVVLETPAERIGQQFFRERGREPIGILQQQLAKALEAVDRARRSTVVPTASTGLPDSSIVRQPPIASKFSSAKPGGSITA